MEIAVLIDVNINKYSYWVVVSFIEKCEIGKFDRTKTYHCVITKSPLLSCANTKHTLNSVMGLSHERISRPVAC